MPAAALDAARGALWGRDDGFFIQALGKGENMSEKFDAIVIGTGQAGPSLASRMSGEGMNVAVIERKLFGGTCVNTG